MNIFGFFLFLRFHTYYKSADDIKKIHNLMAPGQVTLLMFSSYSRFTDNLFFTYESILCTSPPLSKLQKQSP